MDELTTENRRQVRVLHVTQPIVGGVATVVRQLAVDQIARGYAVSIACPEGALATTLRNGGAQHFYWAAARTPGMNTLKEIRSLSRILAAAKPSIVILHSAKAGLVGRLVIRGRITTIYVPHAWSFHASTGIHRSLARHWERLAQRWTARTVCVGKEELATGRLNGIRGRMEVIRNGVDLTVLGPKPVLPKRRELNQPDVPTAVCVGRLAHQKGQDLLIAAWSEVVRVKPAARLVLVGAGPAHDRLRRLAGQRVDLVGPTDDVGSWYAIADVVVLPSRWEGMSLVLLEAMATGKSIVCFNFDGALECLGDSGAVVPLGDVSGLAEALVERLSNPERAIEEGRRARERVEEIGDLHRTLNAWDDCLISTRALE